jgi:hypothetical protein
MATEIQLHHIGEVVLAGLLRQLAKRGELDVPCVLHEKCQYSAVLAKAKIGPPLTFSANVPLASVVINREELLFDGAHGIDVLSSGHEARGLAVEAKLGLDRMASGEFRRRFLAHVSLTTHTRRRIKGSMVAILNYRALHGGEALPLRTMAPFSVEIVPAWFLVIRRAVWANWTRPKGRLPPLAADAHVAIFEDIVQKHGNARSFDALVRRLVGADFYRSWGLGSVS